MPWRHQNISKINIHHIWFNGHDALTEVSSRFVIVGMTDGHTLHKLVSAFLRWTILYIFINRNLRGYSWEDFDCHFEQNHMHSKIFNSQWKIEWWPSAVMYWDIYRFGDIYVLKCMRTATERLTFHLLWYWKLKTSPGHGPQGTLLLIWFNVDPNMDK